MKRVAAVLVAAACTFALAGCSLLQTLGLQDDPDDYPENLKLAQAEAVGNYNPLNGFGNGMDSWFYDGLLAPGEAEKYQIPPLQPALAQSLPKPSSDLKTWRVKLREDAKFFTGRDVTADDVVATYQAVLDPQVDSPIASYYDMISEVKAIGPHEVQFTLSYPFADFPTRMMLGIVHREDIEAKPVKDWKLNEIPNGTGPYRMRDRNLGMYELMDRDDSWHPRSPVRFAEIYSIPDDEERSEQLLMGRIDGAVLPGELAQEFNEYPNFSVRERQSAAWYGFSFPTGHPFTTDTRVRVALNRALGRDEVVSKVFNGYAIAAYTPTIQSANPQHPAARALGGDRQAALDLLADAGWVRDASGALVKDGQPAELTLWNGGGRDRIEVALTEEVARQLRELGVKVEVDDGGQTSAIERRTQLAVLTRGGKLPPSMDMQLYGPLHTPGPDTDPMDNPAGATIAGVDELLDKARVTASTTERERIYEDVTTRYAADPTYLMVSFPQVVSVQKHNNWRGQTRTLVGGNQTCWNGIWHRMEAWHK